MLRPRWKKVLRDLAANRARTAVVVLSITVGVFAFGTIMTTRIVLNEQLRASYLATNPASAVLTLEPFDKDLVDAVGDTSGVAMTEGRRVVTARVQTGPGSWQDALLYVLPQDGVQHIGIVTPQADAWPPRDKTILIERSTFARGQTAVGGTLRVSLAGHEPRDVPVAGITHDLSLSPAASASQVVGYVTADTLVWLGGPSGYDQLAIVVAEGREDKEHIAAVAARAARVVRNSGRKVLATDVPTPLQHPAEAVLPAVMGLLTGLSILAVLISIFLIINTISAILTQQTRQIGVMKAIGARSGQLAGLYFTLSAAFGVMALCLAVPLSAGAAYLFTRFLGGLLNVDIVGFRLPLEVVAMQALIAVLVPLVASFFPVRSVVGRPAREALAGSSDAPTGDGLAERAIGALRGLGRPMRLTLRNVFRRKGRLVRTLAALALGGAVFISVMSLRDSLYATMDASIATQRHDIEVQLGRPYRIERLLDAAAAVPGVVDAEGLRHTSALLILADGAEGEALNLRAMRADTTLVAPNVVAGRWLSPDDERAVVLTSNYLVKHPDAKVGDTVLLKINGEEYTWRIVGLVQELIPPVSPATAYVPLDAYARATGGPGKADLLRVVTGTHDAASHAAASAALERELAADGFDVRFVRSRSGDRAVLDAQFGILIAVLTLMALLIGVVGGLGLSGTMSINVMERTREIGVMRAIGASDGAVRGIVLGESLAVAVLSWLIAFGASLPLSYGMSIALGVALLNTPLTWVYALVWASAWLVIVLVMAAAASLLPARSASRLTIREVLAYE